MPQVILDETGNEVVAVVVARMPTQQQRLPTLGTCLIEQLGLELGGEEAIRLTLIDQDRAAERVPPHQLARVIVGPGGGVFAQITGSAFCPHGT